jgi:cytoskeleton protein RodZ
MTSPGQELKKDREARGISLKTVSDATRITQRNLEAVESDRLDLLPGGFFIKGILKAYAGAVGLDEDAVLERYRRAGVLAARAPESARKQAPDGGRSKKRTLSMAGAAAVIIIVIFSFAAYFLTRPGRTAAPPEDVRPSPGVPVRPEPIPPAATAAATVVAPEAEKGLRIEISFTEKTWIQVYADGRLALDGVRAAGDTAQVRAETELLVHLGNAGGFAYTLNGKPGKPLGGSGAVVKNIRITAGNLASFVRQDGTGPGAG